MTFEQKLDNEISAVLATIPSLHLSSVGRKKIKFGDFLKDQMLMIALIQRGVPYSLFDLIRATTPFSESDWTRFLDISTKSLHRYKLASKDFRPLQSEKIIEMAEVTRIGEETFGDLEKFRLWLETPNFALGNVKPKELLKDSYGKELVIGELTRIDHGILA